MLCASCLPTAAKSRGNGGFCKLRMASCRPDGVFSRLSNVVRGQCDASTGSGWLYMRGLAVTLEAAGFEWQLD